MNAFEIIKQLNDNNIAALVVGGAVRDLVAGNVPYDYDIECYHTSIEHLTSVLSTLGTVNAVGKEFGVLKCKIDGFEYDVALARTENRIGVGHRDFNVDTNEHIDPYTASLRRDFTVNAMAMNQHGELVRLSGHFGDDTERLVDEFNQEAKAEGTAALISHLRLCGAIPEAYDHDSSEEKLYSKYTDVVIAASYQALGISSYVVKERANSADVEGVARGYSFVGDAKAFRLSRTAKNQKDFKVEAMHSWKRGKPFAMVVCPIYQLPSRSSQIYQQAASRNVAVFSYNHLAVLVRFAEIEGHNKGEELLHEVFKSVQEMMPSQSAVDYWTVINRTLLQFSKSISQLWIEEKQAAVDSISAVKEEALLYVATERERIMRLTRDEAIQQLLDTSKLASKSRIIASVTDNGLLYHE